MPDPILILQPRRLGDLILTFPLLLTLQRRYPDRAIWIMAQRQFYEPLLPFAPKTAFFEPAKLPEMSARTYEAIINLGSDEASAVFTGQTEAKLKLGRVKANDRLAVNGFWHLYRESLTQNNRHNIFHWADLFRLDLGLPLGNLIRPNPKGAGKGRIGLFVGASEASKRPGADFWAGLANYLAKSGFKPVLLGGPGEVAMGMAIMAKGTKAANFCGKTSLSQLAGLLQSLDLLITPDTGPMHLADWLAVPVLNLSLGNVHAPETGPLSPGQQILRANASCVGCWQCWRDKLHCRDAFKPHLVGKIAVELASGQPSLTPPPGLEVLETCREPNGLYRLSGRITARTYLENFWQAAFLYFNDPVHEKRLKAAANALLSEYEELAIQMRAGFGEMLAQLAANAKSQQPLTEAFFKNRPLHSRLFAGFLQLSVQNSGPEALPEQFARIDALQAVLA